jgi:hypothetical protein
MLLYAYRDHFRCLGFKLAVLITSVARVGYRLYVDKEIEVALEVRAELRGGFFLGVGGLV